MFNQSIFLTFGNEIDNILILIILIFLAAGILSYFKIKGVAPILIFGGCIIVLAGSMHLISDFVYSIGILLFALGITLVIYTFKARTTDGVDA